MTTFPEKPHWIKNFDAEEFAFDWYPTGSNWICEPKPEDSDYDYILFCESQELLEKHLIKEGFHCETDGDYDAIEFYSWRNGKFNALVCVKFQFFIKWQLATQVARRLNILDRDDRVALFQVVLYNTYPLKEGLDF